MIIADKLACLIVGIFVIAYFYTCLTSLHNETSPANLVGSIFLCKGTAAREHQVPFH